MTTVISGDTRPSPALDHITAYATRSDETTAAIRAKGYAGKIVVGKDLGRY